METPTRQPPNAPRKHTPRGFGELKYSLCLLPALVLATAIAAHEFPDTAVGTPCWNVWRGVLEPNHQRDLDRVDRSAGVVAARVAELEASERTLGERIDAAKAAYSMAVFNRDFDDREFAWLVADRDRCQDELGEQRAVLCALTAARAELQQKVKIQKIAAARREARLFGPRN